MGEPRVNISAAAAASLYYRARQDTGLGGQQEREGRYSEMSWRRGLRHCLPSGFPGSCRLFTILEDRAWYTPPDTAGLVLDAVYNVPGPDDAPPLERKILGQVQDLPAERLPANGVENKNVSRV